MLPTMSRKFSLFSAPVTALPVATYHACLLESTLWHTDICADAVENDSHTKGVHLDVRTLFLK